MNGSYNNWNIVKLNNGVMLIFGLQGNGACQIDDQGTIGWCFSHPAVYVDVDGNRGPNTLCMDIFKLTFDKNKSVYNFSVNSTDRDDLKQRCAKSGESSSTACGALIKLDGWKIKNDYPW